MRWLAAAALFLVACVGNPATQKPPCLEHHYVPVTTFILAGKVMVPVTNLIFVCDKWGEVADIRQPSD